jgi:hypothetical protein
MIRRVVFLFLFWNSCLIYAVEPDEFRLGLEVGASYNEVFLKQGYKRRRDSLGKGVAALVAARAYALFSAKHELGAGLQYYEPDGNPLFGIKAVEYGYRISPQFVVGTFFGFARYDTGLSSMGYYMGGRFEFRNDSGHYGIATELAYADNLDRDRLISSDPEGDGAFYYDIFSLNVSANYYF